MEGREGGLLFYSQEMVAGQLLVAVQCLVSVVPVSVVRGW